MDRFDERNPRFLFTYSDPQPRFDRSRVKGLVGKLFDVTDPKFSTAVEIAGGE
jgi:structural maintenance of chromosome 2